MRESVPGVFLKWMTRALMPVKLLKRKAKTLQSLFSSGPRRVGPVIVENCVCDIAFS